jgi:hypothetical protein
MKDVQQQMGNLPLVLHNRWFEPDNDYFTKMKFPFVNEDKYSLPLDEQPYDYMMSKAAEWGLLVYEQVSCEDLIFVVLWGFFSDFLIIFRIGWSTNIFAWMLPRTT